MDWGSWEKGAGAMRKGLNALHPGERGRVETINLPEEVCRSFYRLGLTEGTRVRCLRYCPLGGPGLYLLRGTVLALRREDGAGILVDPDTLLPGE